MTFVTNLTSATKYFQPDLIYDDRHIVVNGVKVKKPEFYVVHEPMALVSGMGCQDLSI